MSAKINKVVSVLIMVFITAVNSQEVNWYSTDQGGGLSTQSDIDLFGVIGQVDTVRMEGGSITVSGGYLPLPADLIFESQFD